MKKVVYNNCFGGFSISQECAEWMANRGNVECIDFLKETEEDSPKSMLTDMHLWDTPRHDAILVLAVEKLGQRAAGHVADLQIREIISDRYYIDEYDGSESVVTPKDIEWIMV